MSAPADPQRHEWNRRFAAECFNRTWENLDQPTRTPEQARAMIAAAFASRHHWQEVGEPLNFAIGDWQIARVLTVGGYPEVALDFGAASLETCRAHALPPFYAAYAHEALARAHAFLRRDAERDAHLREARALAEAIEKVDDRAALLADLETVPSAEV